MKEFLSTYIELLQNNHDMVGQVSINCFIKRLFTKIIPSKVWLNELIPKYCNILWLEKSYRSVSYFKSNILDSAITSLAQLLLGTESSNIALLTARYL